MIEVVRFAAAEIVADGDAGVELLGVDQIDPDPLADGGEINIPVPNVEYRSRQRAVISRALVRRSRLRRQAGLDPPIWEGRFEHRDQHDTRRVLPFLQRRRCLRKRSSWA